jgi:23S rRNA pseudouridine2605 synthase
MPEELERLNKRLAFLLGVSRREADMLIECGRITVDDEIAPLGARVRSSQVVALDGKPIESEIEKTYIALNKPVGYVCSRRRQGEFPTIYELLPEKYRTLKSVGRLDKDSSGLIILSNDGDFAQRMTHPRFAKRKQYEVELGAPLEPLHQQMIADFGVELPDGESKLGLERIDDDRRHWIVTMSEGRNRQIRRTFAVLGYTVTKLHRTHFGSYELDGLAVGAHVTINVQQ